MSGPPAMGLEEARAFVAAVAGAYALGAAAPTARPAAVPAAGGKSRGRVLVCAPHPDDESLTGALALRLAREGGCEVTAVALTLGSDPVRRQARGEEFAAATALLGWEGVVVHGGRGFGRLTLSARAVDPGRWQRQVTELAELFTACRPDLVLLPHADDSHPTHVGSHHLAMAALGRYTARGQLQVLVAASEFWRPLAEPNLLVGVGEDDVARLVAAVACHGGEVARRPYHARLPFRMVDNVRRGGELMAGYGSGAAAALLFGELYLLGRLAAGVFHRHAVPLVVPPCQPLTLAGLAGGAP